MGNMDLYQHAGRDQRRLGTDPEDGGASLPSCGVFAQPAENSPCSDGAERQRYAVFSHILPLSFQCVWHASCYLVVTMRFIGEMRESEFFVFLGSVLGGHALGTLSRDRHAQRQSLFAFLHVAAKALHSSNVSSLLRPVQRHDGRVRHHSRQDRRWD
jgi:hypothetical protein